MVGAHITYIGRVQGVGFRFTVQRYAMSLNLVGWVRNCPNGSVEMLVEGAKKDIEKLCQNVEEYFTGHIRNREIQFTTADRKLTGFEIAY